ncbi:MAG: LemA family protein [Clostridiales bacterium]|jgi:LemA protein|nr:LemA family protein [Clostridiales bacterium]
MSTPAIIAVVAAGLLILILLIWVVSFYNRIKVKENNIENAFAQLDVQFKRRYDLIPNLADTVKGYTKHESETLTEIVKLRNAAQSAVTVGEKLSANDRLEGTGKLIHAVMEQYPELKASELFGRLSGDLGETENKFAHYRQFFNDGVLIFNREVVTFPNVLLARLFRINKKEYLSTEAAERENVRVKF